MKYLNAFTDINLPNELKPDETRLDMKLESVLFYMVIIQDYIHFFQSITAIDVMEPRMLCFSHNLV